MTAEINVHPTYQYLPEMQAPDFRRLKESIAECGFYPEMPVIVDEHGRILDGHHRAKAWAELGRDPGMLPVRVMEGLTEEEKDNFIWAVNVPRRHLTTEEKRHLIAHRLKQRPEESNRAIGAAVGVSHVTVQAARAELESSGQIDQTIRPHQRTDQGGTVDRRPLDDEEGQPGDAADHRRMCWVEVNIGYVAQTDRERSHGDLPYLKSERKTWASGRMYVTAGSPKSLMEMGALLTEGCRSAIKEARDRPLLSMLAGDD